MKTLVVIHKDPKFLEDVESLANYIKSELNVHSLVLSSDEEKYNVEYSVTVDWPTLGKKLRKDVGKVKAALPAVTSAQVKQFSETGVLDVAGVQLVTGDLVVNRGVKKSEGSEHLEVNSSNEVLVILDTELYQELINEGLSREIINRVQKLRKKAGLKTTDDIKMEYKVLEDPIGLEKIFDDYSGSFEKALRRPLDKAQITTIEPLHPGENLDKFIMEEVQSVNEATFLLRLLHL